MAIKRRGNRIDITGNDASRIARAILPSMREKTLDIDYEAEVKKVYPKAYVTYGLELFSNKRLWRIENGEGKVLVDRLKSEGNTWKGAYNNMVSQGLITPQTADTNEKAD